MSTLSSDVSSVPLDVDAVRRDFPFLETGIAYLDSANTSQRPRQVLEAMNAYFTQFNANIHRAAYRASEEATERYEAVREKARRNINPYREMTAAARAAGATVLIDGAQGAPHLGVDVREVGCDFYAFSGHKMCGPTGAGVLYGRRELLEAMPPFMGGGDMIRSVSVSGTTYAELPEKFEAGTQAIAEVIGFGAAIDYVSGLGLDRIHAHEQGLVEYALESLSEIEGLRVFGPPASRRAGVVSFVVEGIHAHDLATILDRHGVDIRAGHNCTMPLMTRLDVAATA